jgi:hypothetical protein
VLRLTSIDSWLKFARLSWQDRLLLLEAFLLLALAGVMLSVLPFRRIGFLAGRPTRRWSLPPHLRLTSVSRIRWAIRIAAGRVPWRSLCFQQGLAAQFMLRRRAIPSVLYYGATQDERNGLRAHVWVRHGDVDVVGGEIAYRFAILAMFPEQPDLICGQHPE